MQRLMLMCHHLRKMKLNVGGNGEFYTVLQQMQQQIEAFVERSMPWTGWSIMSLDLIYFIIFIIL